MEPHANQSYARPRAESRPRCARSIDVCSNVLIRERRLSESQRHQEQSVRGAIRSQTFLLALFLPGEQGFVRSFSVAPLPHPATKPPNLSYSLRIFRNCSLVTFPAVPSCLGPLNQHQCARHNDNNTPFNRSIKRPRPAYQWRGSRG